MLRLPRWNSCFSSELKLTDVASIAMVTGVTGVTTVESTKLGRHPIVLENVVIVIHPCELALTVLAKVSRSDVSWH